MLAWDSTDTVAVKLSIPDTSGYETTIDLATLDAPRN